ncbi:MAG: 6-pyruvoyl-tetrahydropterin synthase-related protein [Anaerolineae bacterium]|nr:6-pyruvoyl-tetrahydropterin synthase-related protein [Anaerolineae bacterium]
MSARFPRRAPLLIPLLALPALWHLLTEGLPQEAADGALHLYRLALLEKHVEAGMLYPRWLPELVLGRGYPLFNFYGPASYYVALAFRLIGLPLASSMAMAMAALAIAGGFGAYLLARDTLRSESRWPALVSAVAYIYAPYLLSNVYMRGALAEVAAQALLPWVFWSAVRLMARRESRAVYLILLALSMGAIPVTHNITALFLPLAWLPYAAVVWWVNGRRGDDLLWTAAGVAGAIGLSAIFTVPLLLERQYLAATAVEVARGQIGEHVWTWRAFLDARVRFGYSFDPPYKLGLIQLLLAALGLIAARRRDPVWLYWIGVAVASGFLMSAWAAPLWQGSELLLIAQFPWRLLAWLSLPLALFTGAAVAAVRRPAAQAAAAVGLIALVMLAQTPVLPGLWGWPAVQTPGSVAGLSQFERDTGALGTSSTREFMPKWVESDAPGAVEPAEGAPRVAAVEAASDFGLTLRTEVALPRLARGGRARRRARHLAHDGDGPAHGRGARGEPPDHAQAGRNGRRARGRGDHRRDAAGADRVRAGAAQGATARGGAGRAARRRRRCRSCAPSRKGACAGRQRFA